MQFRTDINALRALAVTLVVLFHFGVPGFDGGFVGVDVFFVISGYLMTKIVMTALERGSFSYLNFVIARVVRIWPALVVMVMALLAIGALCLPPMDYEALGRQAQAALMFDANRHYRDGPGGYFVSGPDERWLLHTWSLAVEWQFYLLYPILLALVSGLHGWLAGRSGRERVLGLTVRQATVLAMCAVWAVSLALCVRRTGLDPVGAFFSLVPRVWEMVSGGLVYMAEPLLAARVVRWGKVWRWAGLALFALAMYGGWAWGWERRWPGVLALAPVVGAMLVLAAGAGGQTSPRWASGRWVQHLGLWSYSVYLWHWPVHVLNNFLLWPEAWAPWVAVLSIAVSVGLGGLSHRWVESRVKFKPTQGWRQPALLWPALGSVAVLGCALMVVLSQGWMGRVGDQASFYQQRTALMKPGEYPPYCHNFKRVRESFRMCSLNAGVPGPRVLVYGDSHAEHLFPWFAAHAQRRVDFFTGGACPPVRGFNRLEGGYHCDHQALAAAGLASATHYDTIIVGGNFGWLDRSPSGLCASSHGSCTEPVMPAERMALIQSNVAEWRRLLALGKRVVVVRQVPVAPYDLPKMAMRRHFLGLPPHETYAEKRYQGAGPDRYLDDVARLMEAVPGFEMVDLRPEICDGQVCRSNDPQTGLPIFFDSNHFVPDWIRAHGGVLAPYVQAVAASTAP